MSGQWEVVGRKKDRGSKLPVPKNTAAKQDAKTKKNNILNGVKLEEVLPKSQVQNLYSSSKSNKENNKPQEKKAQDSGVKKQEKKSKPQDPPKPKPPKSIESGLNSINLDEFKSLFEKNKSLYPDAPIVWLKELVQFVNQKIPVEAQDPVFSTKPEDYPLSAVPAGLKTIIEQSVKEAGKDNTQLFFDIALTAMVTDMSKGLPGTGYRFYLQYIALNEPQLVTGSLSKHVVLRNSYQNRANVALSILWAVGQVGTKDIHCGLKVFQELMLPLIELKNYSHFVMKYLLDLVSRNYNTSLSSEEYLLILDTIFSNKKNVVTEYQNKLNDRATHLKGLLFENNEKPPAFVELLLKRINSNTNKAYRNTLCDVLVTTFSKDQTTLTSWNKVYSKNLPASAVLLEYISNNIQAIRKTVNNVKLKELLENLTKTNDELSLKKRKEDGLKDAINNIKNIQENLSSKKKQSGFFSSLLYVLFVTSCLAIVVELIYKAQHGRIEDTVYKKLSGHVCSGLTYVDKHFENRYPDHHKKVVEVVGPYVELSRDLRKVLYNYYIQVKAVVDVYVQEKYPVVRKSIDSYAPGLIDNGQKVLSNAYSTSILYINRSVDYLQKEVFVGQLSPENMQRVVLEAFNTTSQKATECYHWLYEKVNSSIK